MSTTGQADERTTKRLLTRFLQVIDAVVDADPEEIEATARSLGATRRYLAPVAWVAGMLVLVVRGLKLLVSNYRLLLIEMVPALWVWLTMYQLHQQHHRQTSLQGAPRGEVVVALVIATLLSVAALWCNSVFGFAITHRRPQIRLAMQQAGGHWRRVFAAGVLMGVVVVIGFVVIPELKPRWLYFGFLWGMYGIMLTALVVLPAWIIGIPRTHFGPVETVQRWVTGWALSAVAMAPGFIVGHAGGLFIDVRGLEWLGYVMVTLGAVLYAAGLSSVKAVTLSMKLEIPT